MIRRFTPSNQCIARRFFAVASIPLAALLAACAVASTAAAENWPQWRGARLNGVSGEPELPLVWNQFRGVLWKCKLPGSGASTPIVWGKSLFVTAQDQGALLLVKVDVKTGAIAWRRRVAQLDRSFATADDCRRAAAAGQRFVRHNMATPSPVTDGERVVAHFGNGELAAYDFAGNQQWRRNLADDHGAYQAAWGHANSPLLYGELVISTCIQRNRSGGETTSSYVAAHDRASGKLRWFTPRPTVAEGTAADAYTTPTLVRYQDRWQLAVMGGNILDGYDPESGRRLWLLPRVAGGRAITSPLSAGDMILATQGEQGPLFALRPEGEGELDPRDTVWRYGGGTSDAPTPTAWGDLLFLVTDQGLAKCLDVTTGKMQWSKRIGDDYKASPVAAEARVYFLSVDGKCTVASVSERFDRLAVNEIDDEFLASPAISGGRFYLRGKSTLYCIGNR